MGWILKALSALSTVFSLVHNSRKVLDAIDQELNDSPLSDSTVNSNTPTQEGQKSDDKSLGKTG